MSEKRDDKDDGGKKEQGERLTYRRGDLELVDLGDGPPINSVEERRREDGTGEARDAANKISMREAHYTDDGIGRLRCRFCSMFRPPDACTLVEGDVHPEGVCDHFDHR